MSLPGLFYYIMKEVKSELIGSYIDDHIGSPYGLYRLNAKELSQYLKDKLVEKNIDYNQYNPDNNERGYSWEKDENLLVINNPPREIYEYQNFFLLEKEDGELVLLDGFRRLLWYGAPSTLINVRVYKQEHLSNEKILTLLIFLNHFKFYGGGGAYYDRGFALLLRTVFGLNINKYRAAFNAYLTSTKTRSDYSDYDSGSDTANNRSTKERIVNPKFIDDIRFLEAMDAAGQMVNKFLGATLYKLRGQTDIVFTAKAFSDIADKNQVLKDLIGKYENRKRNRGADATKIINRILEIYDSVFTQLMGGEGEISYAEKLQDAKEMVAKLKKDKTLLKLTGNRKDWLIERAIAHRLLDNKPVRFAAVVMPSERENENDLPYGVRSDIKLLRVFQPRKWGSSPEMVFGFFHEGKEFVVSQSFMRETKFTKVCAKNEKGYGQSEYDVEVFVDITPEEVQYVDDNRMSWRYIKPTTENTTVS